MDQPPAGKAESVPEDSLITLIHPNEGKEQQNLI